MRAGFLRAFARDNEGASSSEYALILFVAGTGLALSTFMLGKAIGDSLIQSASLFAPQSGSASTAAASASADPAAEAASGFGPATASNSRGAVPAADPDCQGKGKSKGTCSGEAKGQGNK